MKVLTMAAAVVSVLALSACAAGGPKNNFGATLSGANEVPPVTTSATGSATITLNRSTKQLTVNGTFSGMTIGGPGAHIHGPAAKNANGPIVANLTFDNTARTFSANVTLTDEQISHLEMGMLYINLHSATFPSGEIRGQIE